MNKTPNKLIILVLLVVLVAGIVVTVKKGLNYELNYSNEKELDLYVKKEIDINEIKQIAKEVLGNDISVRKIELYEDSVAITARDITDEQKTNIVNKVNEKYGTELSADTTEIISISNIKGRDIVKELVLPFVLSTSIVLIYLIIKYFRLGFIKVLFKSIGIIVLAQAELLSFMALTRIPVGRITTILILIIYMISLIGITTRFQNNLKKLKEEEEV